MSAGAIIRALGWLVRHSHDEEHDKDGDILREMVVNARDELDAFDAATINHRHEVAALLAEIERLKAEHDQALAACAEMRAALEGVMRANNAFHEQECNQDPCTCWVVEARVALSRPDLGRGMVVVEIRLLETLREAALGEIMLSPKTLADLDALIKKGGG